ncbi:MAG: hypothetical protein ABI644_12715 [Arenimonas sp.]
MATLTITRDSGYADRVRAYAVMLNGKKIGELKNGESKDFTIAAGSHSIQMKIDWCGSETVRFTASEEKLYAFRVSSNLRGLKIFLALWYVLFDQNSYLQIEKISG